MSVAVHTWLDHRTPFLVIQTSYWVNNTRVGLFVLKAVESAEVRQKYMVWVQFLAGRVPK